jgi:integrase
MRSGELLGLQWGDVDLGASVLRVQRSLARVRGELVFCEVKTARARRQIALSPSTVQTLRRHRAAAAR